MSDSERVISLQDNWSPDLSPEDHKKRIDSGIGAIHDELIVGGVTGSPVPLSGYDRYDIAYALQLTGGGRNNGVVAVGNGSTGKTAFGDLLHGQANRTEVNAQDIEATVYGEESVVTHRRTQGKLRGMSQDNPVAYVNEFGLLEDQTPFYRLFDSEYVEVTGEDGDLTTVFLRDLVAYFTTNFPKRVGGSGERINPMTGPMGSRIAMEIVTGDHSGATQASILQAGANNRSVSPLSPIVPKAATRRVLHELVTEKYTEGVDDSAANSQFMQNIRMGLRDSGLLVPIESADGVARTGQHWYAVTRASMLLQEIRDPEAMERAGGIIKPRHIAKVAALVLPTRVKLSNQAKLERLAESAGRRPSNLEQSIAVRRVIARVAFTELVKLSDERDAAGELEEFINRYSYANAQADEVGIDLDDALFKQSDKSSTAEEPKNGKRKRRIGRRSQ